MAITKVTLANDAEGERLSVSYQMQNRGFRTIHALSKETDKLLAWFEAFTRLPIDQKDSLPSVSNLDE